VPHLIHSQCVDTEVGGHGFSDIENLAAASVVFFGTPFRKIIYALTIGAGRQAVIT
jgi:hypothetical protein